MRTSSQHARTTALPTSLALLLGLAWLASGTAALAATSIENAATTQAAAAYPGKATSNMFGAQLFDGHFSQIPSSGFNPDYRISLGDRINLRLWGAFPYEGQLPVDPQGNIFIPNVGPVAVAGVRNAELNPHISQQLGKVYKSNVRMYASLETAQPVKVFVTGYVKQPGLYGGLAADSPLSYLDKAGGVDNARGSYVDIRILRAGQLRLQIDLYRFLLNGQLDVTQFADGDVIVVGPRQYTFSMRGEVYNAYDFEFPHPSITLQQAMAMARPKPGATHVSIVRGQGSARRSEYHALAAIEGLQLEDGDQLTVTADRYAGTIQIRVEGAHSGEHAIVLPYGASMADILAQLRGNSMSQTNALQLFRQSVAQRQQEMLDVALNKLQESALSARSATKEEADLRNKEAELIGKFVEQARKVTPKGQVILNEENLSSTLLEDGDIIRIPEKSSVVQVHGEVLFPNALGWQRGLSATDYIKRAGGFMQEPDDSRIVIIRQNGAVITDRNPSIQAGDEIMVLPKIEAKNIEITRSITQILYQIAVSAKVIFSF